MLELYEVRFKFTPTLFNCITVDMLVNIVGHKIDGNYESWKHMGQKTARDLFAPSSPHPVFFGGVKMLHNFFFFIFHNKVNCIVLIRVASCSFRCIL